MHTCMFPDLCCYWYTVTSLRGNAIERILKQTSVCACMPLSFISAGKVLLRCGDKEQNLILEDGKIHLPTVEKFFKLQKAQLNGNLYSSTAEGFTYALFPDGDTVIVTGDPAAGSGTQILSDNLFQYLYYSNFTHILALFPPIPPMAGFLYAMNPLSPLHPPLQALIRANPAL